MFINLKDNQYHKYLRWVWGFLGLYILWQFGSAMTRSAFLPGRVRKTLVQYKESASAEQQDPSTSKEKSESPKNLFAPPLSIGNLKCSAVLGDEALFNDQWYKVGSQVEGAEITEIRPASVKLLWQGKEMTLVPFDVPIQYPNKSQPATGNGTSGTKATPDKPPQERIEGGRPGRGGGMMSEERRQMYERYQNASPEERAEMRRQMRERFGGRRGNRGGR